MKTITITDEDYALIIRALEISEKSFLDLKRDYVSRFVNLSTDGQYNETKAFQVLSNKFGDVAYRIKGQAEQ